MDRQAIMRDVRIDTFGYSMRMGRRVKMTHFPTGVVVSADVVPGRLESEVKEELKERLLGRVFESILADRLDGREKLKMVVTKMLKTGEATAEQILDDWERKLEEVEAILEMYSDTEFTLEERCKFEEIICRK